LLCVFGIFLFLFGAVMAASLHGPNSRLDIYSRLKYLHTMNTLSLPSDVRLGNQIIMNVAVSLLAQKYNKRTAYNDRWAVEIAKLGIELYSGTDDVGFEPIEFQTTLMDEYLNTHKHATLDGYPFFTDVYQKRSIMDLVKLEIRNRRSVLKPKPLRPATCMHVRLGDVTHISPDFALFFGILDNTSGDIHFATDSPDDVNMTQLLARTMATHPNDMVSIIDMDEVDTLLFLSTCTNLYLSDGTFSWVAGVLADRSKVTVIHRKGSWGHIACDEECSHVGFLWCDRPDPMWFALTGRDE